MMTKEKKYIIIGGIIGIILVLLGGYIAFSYANKNINPLIDREYNRIEEINKNNL